MSVKALGGSSGLRSPPNNDDDDIENCGWERNHMVSLRGGGLITADIVDSPIL